MSCCLIISVENNKYGIATYTGLCLTSFTVTIPYIMELFFYNYRIDKGECALNSTNQMTIAEIKDMIGEWTGHGAMTITAHGERNSRTGAVTEYLKIEETDVEDCVSYIRKCNINIDGDIQLHNEMGYIRLDKLIVILSRGTVAHLPWSDEENGYVQDGIATPETVNMVKTIRNISAVEMTWRNVMDVISENGGFEQQFTTLFRSITTAPVE